METETPTAQPELNLIKRAFKDLELFTSSDYYEKSVLSTNDQAAILNFLTTIKSDIKQSWEDCGITKEDLEALNFEIGMEITEENAYKARAIIGRWLSKVDFTDLYAMVLGLIKLGLVQAGPEYHKFIREELGYGTEDAPFNMQIPMCLVLGWCLIVESGVAAAKGEQEKKVLMPNTLSQVVFIEKLAANKKCYEARHVNNFPELNWGEIYNHLTRETIGTLLQFFIMNIERYTGKGPHPSEAAYLTVCKRAFKNIGGDPNDYLYRCLDKNDWNLFSFLAEDNV